MRHLPWNRPQTPRRDRKPEILVHICCAPDSTAVHERLASRFRATGFFHNPNIHPEGEYRRRLAEAEGVARERSFPLLHPPYNPDIWHRAVEGLEQEPEGGLRCAVCFRLNLRAAARKAKELGFPLFTTSLTLSPHKTSNRIMAIGHAAGEEFGVRFLAEDFKRQDGFKRSLELSREMRLYRQNYCGCRYSFREARRA